MDYQGNYFPEEHDERESKTYRVVKGIFKWTMYGISFIIYAIIFYVLIVNRDSKILETNYMTALPQMADIETDSIELYRINTKVFMNYDGSLQLYNVDYNDQYGVIEIGVKFNANKLTNGDRGDCLDYKLYDSNGNVYKLSNIVTDDGGRYGFARIIFTGLDIDLDSNDLRYESNNSQNPRTNVNYKLDITKKSDNELIYSFDLYNNETTFSRTEYED